MKYEKIKPHVSISHLVHFFWDFEGDFTESCESSHLSVASVSPKLAFQYIPGMKINKDGSSNNLFVSGIQSQTNDFYELSANKKVAIFGVYFQPYAISYLFNVSAAEITNRNIAIADFLGKEGVLLEERIMNCLNTAERINIITSFIEKKSRDLSPNLKMTMHSVGCLNRNSGNLKIQDLLRSHFLSQRQFERNFKFYTGFSAKYFSRIVRFEKSIVIAYGQHHSTLTKLALGSGYFDQAHMVRDYKEFTGKNPSAYFSEDQSLFVEE
ncbi:helix-turn-helix domain-containing protein [Sphingobacterium deserti]|uniref:Transcriptional regulator, AraC family n=1 Tax=Sphingobacterium deserti TaxID=1229276 RepID=A0A0B8T6H8_9SPHI|nr:helix-turn-helix domain-containing protein [Sphingobacterium deserti]KGE12845.1 transcriptional regulator, AraC family [Sphingobacterium deserti]